MFYLNKNAPAGQSFPSHRKVVSRLLQFLGDFDRTQIQLLGQEINQTLVLHQKWNVVCRRNVVDTHDLLGSDVTEHRNLLHGSSQ